MRSASQAAFPPACGRGSRRSDDDRPRLAQRSSSEALQRLDGAPTGLSNSSSVPSTSPSSAPARTRVGDELHDERAAREPRGRGGRRVGRGRVDRVRIPRRPCPFDATRPYSALGEAATAATRLDAHGRSASARHRIVTTRTAWPRSPGTGATSGPWVAGPPDSGRPDAGEEQDPHVRRHQSSHAEHEPSSPGRSAGARSLVPRLPRRRRPLAPARPRPPQRSSWPWAVPTFRSALASAAPTATVVLAAWRLRVRRTLSLDQGWYSPWALSRFSIVASALRNGADACSTSAGAVAASALTLGAVAFLDTRGLARDAADGPSSCFSSSR